MSSQIQAPTYSLSVEAYHRMKEAGILTANDRVELIRGQIVPMSPKGSKHSSTVRRLTSLLYQCVADSAVISVQDPISMFDISEPEPDLSLLIPPQNRYDARHPFPEDVLLVIEVADSSLAQDRNDKARLYGEAGIPEYWIVNLQNNEVEVYQQPLYNGYKTTTRYQAGESVPVAGLGVALSVDEILGQR